MIERFRFDCLMADLSEMFEKITEEKLNIYYDHLKSTDEDIMEKAVKILIGNHPFKRFPLIAEIKDAVREAFHQSPLPPPEELDGCEYCGGTGIKLKEIKGYMTAIPCTCDKGQRFEKNWDKFKKRQFSL